MHPQGTNLIHNAPPPRLPSAHHACLRWRSQMSEIPRWISSKKVEIVRTLLSEDPAMLLRETLGISAVRARKPLRSHLFSLECPRRRALAYAGRVGEDVSIRRHRGVRKARSGPAGVDRPRPPSQRLPRVCGRRSVGRRRQRVFHLFCADDAQRRDPGTF